jgi:hypothetical protein
MRLGRKEGVMMAFKVPPDKLVALITDLAANGGGYVTVSMPNVNSDMNITPLKDGGFTVNMGDGIASALMAAQTDRMIKDKYGA